MNALELAVSVISRFEGCRLKPYLDSVGTPTIGWGATMIDGKRVTMSTPPLTQAEADALRDADVRRFMAGVQRLITAPCTPQQTAAMTSLAFNVGIGAFGKSTLLRLFNAGQGSAAADEFLKWNMAGGKVNRGLVNRRASERTLFLGGATPAPVVTPPRKRKVWTTPERYLDADALNAASLAAARRGEAFDPRTMR